MRNEALRLRAYGKLNLTLHVQGTRPDGYHLLHSWVQSVDVYDELEVEVDHSGDIWLEVSGFAVPEGERNLAWRAAELLRAHCGVRQGARMRLRKGIPLEAGMGGGSADAAAVLYALNTVWRTQLGNGELARLALRLGADVPFCLRGGLALMQGIGEVLTPFTAPGSLPLVVVYPQARLATADVYRLYDEVAGAAQPTVSWPPDMFLAAWRKGPQELASLLHNDLEVAALRLCPQVGEAKAALLKAGALASAMSGSGPTVFGVVEDDEHALHIAESLRTLGWSTRCVALQAQGIEEV